MLAEEDIMKKLRQKAIEFRITGEIDGVKKKDVVDGILETRDSKLIAQLRALPSDIAEQVFKERAS
jgi:hypothetical protein